MSEISQSSNNNKRILLRIMHLHMILQGDLLNNTTDASPPATVPIVVLIRALSTQLSHLYVSLNSLGTLTSAVVSLSVSDIVIFNRVYYRRANLVLQRKEDRGGGQINDILVKIAFFWGL